MESKDLRGALYQELEELHRDMRSWQRLAHDEVLDYEALNKLTNEELESIINELKKRGFKNEL